MGIERKIAVLIVRHDPSTPFLVLSECQRLILTGTNSVVRYWSEQSENWFRFPVCDFFGPYDVVLAPPPDARENVVTAARNAATAAGVNLTSYDGFVVLFSPGRVSIPNPAALANPALPPTITQGYDSGADGMGLGTSAALVAFESRTFFTHEFGHVLGFDHSWGILNHGIDWAGTGATGNVYGDPYDIMSAQSFGDSDPTATLAATESLTGFPGALKAGPGLARAVLHFYQPLALESVGRVRHINEGDGALTTLHPAGSFRDGEPELLVWHPIGEDASGRGRVYVEYRQYFEFAAGTRWDIGLAQSGDSRTRAGVVVHTVRNGTGVDAAFVWYSGRIAFPTIDTDILIDTDHGPVTISVSADQASEATPAFVRLRVSPPAAPRLWLSTSTADQKAILSSEQRVAPGFAFMGTFTWERRGVTRTESFAPMTAGLGRAPADVADTVNVTWTADGVVLDPTTASTALPKDGRSITLHHTLDAPRRVLTLVSDPADGAYTVTVSAAASEPETQPAPLTASDTFTAVGTEEGWGEDYKRFLRWWNTITHPQPGPHIGPFDPGPIEELGQETRAVERLNPAVGDKMRTINAELVRSQLRPAVGQPILQRPQ
jgi:hypothetical protein